MCEEKDRLLERCGIVHGTEAQISALDPAAVLGLRARGATAQRRCRAVKIPAGMEITPAGLEDVFVFMVKDARRAGARAAQ